MVTEERRKELEAKAREHLYVESDDPRRELCKKHHPPVGVPRMGCSRCIEADLVTLLESVDREAEERGAAERDRLREALRGVLNHGHFGTTALSGHSGCWIIQEAERALASGDRS